MNLPSVLSNWWPFGGGASVSTVAGGTTDTSAIEPVEPDRQVVVSGMAWYGTGARTVQALAQQVNSQGEALDPYVVRAMLDDPAVYAAHETWKVTVLAAEGKTHPAFEASSDQVAHLPGDPEEARRAADFCRDALARLDPPFDIWAKDALDASAYGHRAAEKVLQYLPEQGAYTLASLKMMPFWSYQLCTNPFGNLVALYCQTTMGSRYINKDHFAIFSWDVRDNDPRGSSRFRAAKDPWRRKLRAKEARSKGDDQFATPSLDVELPPNAPLESPDPRNPGGPPIPTTEAMQIVVSQTFENGGVLVHGSGGSTKVIESQRDGTQLNNSIDYYDREITRAILLQDRATMNAEHYTQGGADAGQDIIADDAGIAKRWLCSIVEKQLFYPLLAINKGEQYARLYTPQYTLGSLDLKKFAEFITPVAVMLQAGGLTPSQINKFFAMFGLPTSQPGELRIGPSGPIPDKLVEAKTETANDTPTDPASGRQEAA